MYTPVYAWIRLDTAGYGWIRLDTVGYGWIRLDTVGYGWMQMDADGCRRRHPDDGNEHPHEGKAQGAERRGKCSSDPPRWKFWQSAERLRLDPDDGKA